MIAADHWIRQGDTLPIFSCRLLDNANPPAGYNQTYTPPGAPPPPPPPPPGHYEWDPTSRRWIWRYDRSY